MLLAAPLSHAQQPVPAVSTARSSSSQAGSATPRSVALASPSADRSLSTAPEWAALRSRTADSTETDPALRAQRIEGGIHLTFGTILLGGGVFSGVVAYKLFRNPTDSELIRMLSFITGGVFVVSAIGFTALGIYAMRRGIRILKGEAPPIGWVPGPHFSTLHHSSPFSQHSSLSITIPL